jgi:hypothetical protein
MTTCTSSAPALAGEPASKGGWGSYSMASWIDRAVVSSTARATSASAMSIPEDTPAAVMYLPSSTTRRAT